MTSFISNGWYITLMQDRDTYMVYCLLTKWLAWFSFFWICFAVQYLFWVYNTIIMLIFFNYLFVLQKNIPFDEWFKLEPIADFHKVILARDFMAELAPEHWPPGKRIGFCYAPRGATCEMKNGSLVYRLSINFFNLCEVHVTCFFISSLNLT